MRICLSKSLRVKFVFVIIFLFIPLFIFAAAEVSNLTISPAAPCADQVVTISFDLCNGESAGNNREIFFGVGLVRGVSSEPDQDVVCKSNALVTEYGVYTGDTANVDWWIDGVTQTASGLAITDVGGFDGAMSVGVINGDSCATQYHVDIITKIPPEQAGDDYRIYVATRAVDFTLACCGSGTGSPDDYEYTSAFTTCGIPDIRADLLMCSSQDPDNVKPDTLKVKFQIYNWGESGITLDRFQWEYCFYDTLACNNTNFDAQGSTNFQNNYPNGDDYCAVQNPTLESTFTAVTYFDCGDDRTGNCCFQMGFANLGARPFLIPPGGGWIEVGSPDVWFGITSTDAWDTSDDYSRIDEWPNCDTFGDITEVPLYFDTVKLCEYESGTTEDSDSGENYCYVEDCDFVAVEKSISSGEAVVGDTLTYCISYTNNTDQFIFSFDVWDTVPGITSFVNPYNGTYDECDYSGNTYTTGCTISGNTITWTNVLVPPGGSGTVCFAVTVDSYPLLDPEFLPRSIYARFVGMDELFLGRN